MIPVVLFSLAFLLLILSSVLAHEQPGLVYDSVKCSKPEHRPFISYHIHALFWQSNNDSVTAAADLKNSFGEHFGISEDNDHCDFEARDVEPQQTQLCFFDTEMKPIGPFLTGNIIVTFNSLI